MTLSLDAVSLVLLVPAVAAGVLAVLPGYRLSAALNVLASLLTLAAAVALLFVDRAPAAFLFVDDLNIVFIVLTTLVGSTTSVFSASYIAHELEIGRLTPTYLRFYHAMYQVMMFGMNLALLANNIGLMWVAIEIATLSTVLMVGIYRTHEALEAAWKYFILGSVGIALALFGTILVYMAARPVVGEGLDGMIWTVLVAHVARRRRTKRSTRRTPIAVATRIAAAAAAKPRRGCAGVALCGGRVASSPRASTSRTSTTAWSTKPATGRSGSSRWCM